MTDARTFFAHADDGAQLCAQAIGNQDDPALLLIGGATWSMDWWADDLCHQLADRRLRVIRYDARDTGRSTAYPVGKPGYGGAELVGDVISVLDHLGVDQAHFMGLSMGGGIAQRLALEHRARTATLTLLSTTPIDPEIQELPPPSERILATFVDDGKDLDWTDREAVVAHIVEGERPFAGPGNFDEPALREIAGRVFDRTHNIAASLTNHFMLADGGYPDPDLRRLTGVPTLVMHGTADPMFPIAHGRALADVIPGARLNELTDVGHQLPPRHLWPFVIDTVVDHTAGS